MGRFILVVGLLFLMNFRSFGQTRTFYEHGHKIEHFTEKDGLPSWQINGAHQGESGHLWMATPNGIIKHDGYTFERINLSEKIITNTLKDYLAGVIEQNNGQVTIGTLSGGLIRYNQKEKSFKRFLTGNRAKDYIGGGLTEDSLGNVWASSVKSILQLTPQDSLIVHEMKAVEQPINALLKKIQPDEVIQKIENPNQGSSSKVNFELTQNSKLNLICISRIGKNNQLVDYAWIENDVGKKVWKIDLSNSVNAGGNYFFNRANLENIQLEKGNYTLHYTKKDEPIPNLEEEYLENYASKKTRINQGIYLLKGTAKLTTELAKIKDRYAKENKMTNDFLPYVFIDKSERIWVNNTHLVEVKLEGNQMFFEEYCSPLDSTRLCPCEIVGIANKSENELWILGKKWIDDKVFISYLGYFDKVTRTFKEIKTILPEYKFFQNGPGWMTMDDFGNVWIGTGVTSLYKLSPPYLSVDQRGQPNMIQFRFGVPNSRVTITGVTIDQNHNLWAGTRSNGMYKLDLKKPSYHYFELPDSINVDKLFKMREDSENNIWLNEDVTKNKIYKISNDFEKIEKFQHTFKGIPFERFMSPLTTLPDGNHLFRSLKDLVVYNPVRDSIIKVIPSTVLGRAGVGNTLSFVINDSLLYVNNFIFNYKDWTIFKKFDSYLNGRYFSNGLKSNKEGFWLGGFHGDIGQFRINGNSLDTLQVLKNEAFLAGLAEDKEGNCWISTGYGLQGFLNGQVKPKNFSKLNGDYHNLYGNIFTDDKNNLWVFPANGIVTLSIRDSTIYKVHTLENVDIPDGFSPPNIIQNNKGAFRILGKKGIYTFHPDSLMIDSIAPKIVFESINFMDDKEEKLIKPYNNQSQFSFNYQQNDLTFEYVGINFNNSELITYAYQMQGLSNEWQQVDKEKSARFLDLPPGEYTFKVKAANADGIWSKPKSLKITILPPWWQTWWAYILYAVAAIGSLWWYIQSLNKKLAKEQAHNQELTDLNEANQRFVPQDILTILGKESIKDLQLGDQMQTQMTVLFSDIRDYTPLSESMTPEENFKFINSYLGRVGPIIKEHGGFISSYLGDGLMALFVNEPAKAVVATIAIQKELDQYNQIRLRQNRKALRTGMGLNTGELMLGVIGDEYRYESTVISDAVNTASRMEGLTKVFGAAIILSERTLEGLKEEMLGDTLKVSPNISSFKPNFAYRYLGKVKVKGKDKAIKIYDLYEGEPIAIRQLKAQTHLQFEQGITHYYQKEFGKAAECFKQVLTVNETDKAAQYYLEKSVGYIVNGVTADWSGVEEMVMK